MILEYEGYNRKFNVVIENVKLIIFITCSFLLGWIDTFLSSKFWLPVSRLSYCIFLLNPAVLLVNLGRVRTAHFFDEFEIVSGTMLKIIHYLYTCLFHHAKEKF
jgi:hypothetical protein